MKAVLGIAIFRIYDFTVIEDCTAHYLHSAHRLQAGPLDGVEIQHDTLQYYGDVAFPCVFY